MFGNRGRKLRRASVEGSAVFVLLPVFLIFGFPLALLLAIQSGFKKNSRAKLIAADRRREAILYTTELRRQQLAVEREGRKRNERGGLLAKIIGLFIVIGALAARPIIIPILALLAVNAYAEYNPNTPEIVQRTKPAV